MHELNQCTLGGIVKEKHSNSVIQYRLDENVWRSVKPLNHRRSGTLPLTLCLFHSIFLFNFFILFHSLSLSLYLSTSVIYDKYERIGSGAAVVQNMVYVCGGRNETETLSSCEVYDKNSDTWQRMYVKMNFTCLCYVHNICVTVLE